MIITILPHHLHQTYRISAQPSWKKGTAGWHSKVQRDALSALFAHTSQTYQQLHPQEVCRWCQTGRCRGCKWRVTVQKYLKRLEICPLGAAWGLPKVTIHASKLRTSLLGVDQTRLYKAPRDEPEVHLNQNLTLIWMYPLPSENFNFFKTLDIT